ncbi:E3 ubiquitin-protein ligase ZNRF2 [Toxocara canis]|uniref:E3 ubiquitin-protein ligase ZNRF1 n=1 Tax=Toxocara canis TaxID=6265 RepID=A0A0B2W528_TOXCA|nr:E3 ubiquitin-protein ligase ZNRF2 [Toxocara canis]
MGGRQSVQTDVHRRPRSNSAVESSTVGVALSTHRNPSRSVTGVGGSTALGGRVGSESTSDSDEDGQATSSTLHASTSHSIRHPPLRFSIPHLRPHRSMTTDGTTRRSVPVFQILGRLSQDIKCPVCHKTVPSDEAEVHLVMCLTRPKVTYNEDVLTEDKGECAICLEEMLTGNCIARLPCLCIYHKGCIDEWFTRKNCCPEHPGDD